MSINAHISEALIAEFCHVIILTLKFPHETAFVSHWRCFIAHMSVFVLISFYILFFNISTEILSIFTNFAFGEEAQLLLFKGLFFYLKP